MTLHTSIGSFSSLFFLTLLHVQPSLATSHSHTTYNFLHSNCIFYSSLRVMHPCGLELAIALGTFSTHFVLLPRLPPHSHLTCHLSSKICQLSQVQHLSLCVSLHFFHHHQYIYIYIYISIYIYNIYLYLYIMYIYIIIYLYII